MYTFPCYVPVDFAQELQPKPRQVFLELADGTMVPVRRDSSVEYKETEHSDIHTISISYLTKACHQPTNRKLSTDELL